MRIRILSCFLFLAISLQAQEFTYQDEWLDQVGSLSNLNVSQVVRDFRGYLWVATAEGLNRYDGAVTRKYFADGSEHGLPSNHINALFEVVPGKLLVGTNNGLCLLNTINGEFEKNPIRVPALRNRSGLRICSFFRDSKNRIWVSHQDGYDLLDTALNHLMRISDQPWATDLQGSHVFYAGWTEDRAGRIWLPTDEAGIIIVDEAARKVQSWKTNAGDPPFFQRFSTRAFWLDEDRKIAWYAPSGKGLFRYDLNRKTIRQQLFGFTEYGNENTINYITPVSDSLILCYSGYGPWFVNRQTMTHQRPDSWLFNNRRKYTIRQRMADGNGNIWEWGDEGLAQILRVRDSARVIPYYPIKNMGSMDMVLSGSQLYLSYYKDGLEAADLRQKTNMVVPPPDNTYYSINHLALDPMGSILASSEGIYRYNARRKNFSPLASMDYAFMTQRINDLHNTPDGTVWWACSGKPSIGSYFVQNGQDHFLEIALPEQVRKRVPQREVLKITHDTDGNLWMLERESTSILCYMPGTRYWKIYRPPLQQIGQAYLSEFSDLHPGKDGVLWLGNSTGGGLIRYDTRSGKISQVQRKQGLSSDIVYSICADNQDNLFIKTSDGIDLFNTTNRKLLGTVSWVVHGPMITSGKMYFDSATQRLILGTHLGIAFIPERLWLKTYIVPAIHLDEIRVSNQRMPFPSDGKPLVLEPGRNDLSLFFSSVNYDPRNELLYSYRLDKRDRDWSTPSDSRNANYTGLPPGAYRFQVRAITPLGKTGAISEFQLVIRPAFWQTAWFRILLVTSIIAAAYGYFRSRLLSVRQEAALQRQMAETEMNLLRSQIKPHFIFNCLSAIDNLIQTNQVDRATAYLAKFARMLRSVIESTRNDTIPIQKDIETMRNYILLEQFMCNGKFEFVIDTDPALADSDVKVPPMIIQPFLENAIRHGLLNKVDGERILRIRIELDQDIVRYTITDNGVGQTKSKEFNDINKPGHESFGIRITADRIRLLDHGRQTSGYKIEDLGKDGISSGTRVLVWIDTAPQ